MAEDVFDKIKVLAWSWDLINCLERSLYFHDFVANCLTKEPRLRPAASEMFKMTELVQQE
ncbi:serine/threonine-protein kinase dst1 [Trifolium medium]|uniref:Serine/threonine-protein kinase dst1 n=1 Tax=Trifolium medium TaxID=97028 RepID=A0A392MAM6_9FABA|nr:serine/threonine-protein kinase dst1 [Trifolium medium]